MKIIGLGNTTDFRYMRSSYQGERTSLTGLHAVENVPNRTIAIAYS
jgi:hypothetical protein